MSPAFFIFESMRSRLLFSLLLLFGFYSGYAQRVKYAQSIIDTLCSPYFEGRGYTHEGHLKTSTFLKVTFEEMGIKPLINNSFLHDFHLNVNTFPDQVEIKKNGTVLPTGRDYIISPDFPSMNIEDREVVVATEDDLLSNRKYKHLIRAIWKGDKILVVDTIGKNEKAQKRLAKILKKYPHIVHFETVKKLTWSVSRTQSKKGKVYILPSVLSTGDHVSLNIEAWFREGYGASNVAGMIPGTERPDSMIILTGHYDHLGAMGSEAYIPGANDNASGIAMILDMAQYFLDNPPRYTVVFVAFGAEEAGLVGSYHFVKDMAGFLDPKKIRFVVNMDLMGSGQEGIMAVNGAVFNEEYALLEKINNDKNYLTQTKKRGKAANSDHYFFSEAGIPAFFFYLMGPYHYYHDIDDNAENLRLNEKYYNGSFLLIRDFIQALMYQ